MSYTFEAFVKCRVQIFLSVRYGNILHKMHHTSINYKGTWHLNLNSIAKTAVKDHRYTLVYISLKVTYP